jgi:ATP-dependent Clp protease ATP-binding subunit ClpA
MQISGGFERFTDRARRVLTHAQAEAQRRKHNYIGAEHILLGLLHEDEGVAVRVLGDLGIEPAVVRSRVDDLLGTGEREVTGEIGLTPRAKKVIELSVKEARRLGHHYIGTEHLLLGLFREEEGIPARVLEQLGVSLEKARSAVIKTLTQSGSTPPPAPEPDPSSLERPDLTGFSERARKVIALTEEEARRFKHNYIGTEHVLLGLLREGEGTAARVLESLGLELQKVRNAVEFIIGRGERPVTGELGFTPRANKVLALARDSARKFGSGTVETEHLLLGLIREGEGIAAGVLESMGISLARVQSQIVKMLAKQGVNGTPPLFAPAHRAVMIWEYLPVLVQMRETAPREQRLVCAPTAHGQELPHEIDGMRIHHALHVLGADGWELAGIDSAHRTDEGPASVYIFKRPQ